MCISSIAMLKSLAFELIRENTVPSMFGKDEAKTLLAPIVVILPGFSLIPLIGVSLASRESLVLVNWSRLEIFRKTKKCCEDLSSGWARIPSMKNYSWCILLWMPSMSELLMPLFLHIGGML